VDKKVFSFIFARGGSKGIPNKNLRLIDNIPLVGHSIKIAQETNYVDKVFVSTDSDLIANTAKAFKAEVIKRPNSISKDESPEWLAWKHAVNYVNNKYGEFDVFLSLPATSPLRSIDDINNCIKLYLNNQFESVISIVKSDRSPWFNMVKKSKNNNLNLLLDKKNISRRQDSPESYDITTVAYVIDPKFILNANNIWERDVLGVEIPKERAIDIDNLFDFKVANFLYHENKEKRNIEI
tara:strand:+ start:851 stop:1564 length:714 start_codon:yes stop_codon:yes gene_type:complete